MGKQRSHQLQDGRGFIKDGSVVGDVVIKKLMNFDYDESGNLKESK